MGHLNLETERWQQLPLYTPHREALKITWPSEHQGPWHLPSQPDPCALSLHTHPT